MSQIVNYLNLRNEYLEENSLDYLTMYNVRCIEEVYLLLSYIVNVDMEKLKTLCTLPNITENEDYLRKLMYNSVLEKLHDRSPVEYIKFHLDKLHDDFMNDRISIEEIEGKLRNEPLYYHTLGREVYVYLCCYIEYVFSNTLVEMPSWMEDSFYFLEYPYIDKKGEIDSSRVQFTKRNYFCKV